MDVGSEFSTRIICENSSIKDFLITELLYKLIPLIFAASVAIINLR